MPREHSNSMISKALGWGDLIALGVISGARALFGGGFYSSGWGESKKVEAAYKYIAECISSGCLPEIDITLTQERILGKPYYVCRFKSPMAEFLPSEISTVDFCLVPGPKGMPGLKTFDDFLNHQALKGVVLQCAGTADEYYMLRETLFAKPMWEQHDFGSMVFTMPFYGSRRVKGQFMFVMRSVEEYRLQYLCGIFEAACIVAHVRRRLASLRRSALPSLTTGMSMGGCISMTAASVAAMDASVRGPIAAVPCLGPTNPYPLAECLLFHIGNYDALAKLPHCPVSDAELEQAIRNGDLEDTRGEGEEHLTGVQHFGLFRASGNLQLALKSSNTSIRSVLSPADISTLKLRLLFKRDSIDQRFLRFRNPRLAGERVRAFAFVNAEHDWFVKSSWSKDLSALGDQQLTLPIGRDACNPPQLVSVGGGTKTPTAKTPKTPCHFRGEPAAAPSFMNSLAEAGLDGHFGQGLQKPLLTEEFVPGGHLGNYFLHGRTALVKAAARVADFAVGSFVQESVGLALEAHSAAVALRYCRREVNRQKSLRFASATQEQTVEGKVSFHVDPDQEETQMGDFNQSEYTINSRQPSLENISRCVSIQEIVEQQEQPEKQ